MSSQSFPAGPDTNNRKHDMVGTNLGGSKGSSIAKFEPEHDSSGALASRLTPVGGSQLINVVANYRWTLSDLSDTEEIPYIKLKEYYCNEAQLKRRFDAFAGGIRDLGKATTGEHKEILSVYDSIFPKDNPTKFEYMFPYFNQTGFELNSRPWEALDSLGDSLKELGSAAIGAIAQSKLSESTNKAGRIVGNAAKFLASDAGKAAVEGIAGAVGQMYASVGEVDRPKIFMGHNTRQISITFPLYNTVSEEDWGKNRDLIYLLMSQNLFNKRDFTTGVPPVFYDVHIPGQYYSYASCMTDVKVEYLGNQRLLYSDYVIPDGYQVTLTLQEMLMPSKNQFEAVTNGSAKNYVTASTSKK
jgi:hypothetical protein